MSALRKLVRRAIGFVKLMAFFVFELLLANFRVAYEIVTPRNTMRPAVVAVRLEADTEEEILAISTLISLTPDSLTLDVSSDGRTIYVHSMFVRDPEKLRLWVKNGFERRVLEVTR